MLHIKELTFSYGKKKILEDISFSAQKGEVISIIGPNGCGKTTLLKCINKINKPKLGEIFIDDTNILKCKIEEISKKVAYVPQMLNENFDINVTDVVMMGRRPYINWSVSENDLEIVSKIMKKLNIENIAEKSFIELSGGQKQKVLIARAFVQDAPMYIFDEPISFLDIKNQLEILNMAKEFAKKENKIVIIVLHDLNMAMAYSDKVLLLKDGKVNSFNETKKVLTKENIKEVYGIDVKIIDNYIVPQI